MEVEPFDTDLQLTCWLRERGLEHLRGLGADVLWPHLGLPSLSSGLQAVLARHRFTDFATAQSMQRYGYALAYSTGLALQLPLAARRFLEREQADLAQARAESRGLLEPPSEPSALPAHRSLVALRARFPSQVAPRSQAVLSAQRLHFDSQLPGFCYQEDRRWLPENRLGYGLITPAVALKVTPTEASAECSCGAKACLHALSAVDATLLWLRQPLTPALSSALEELARPSWERALRAIDLALQAQGDAAAAPSVSWRLSVFGSRGIELVPYLHRITRKGTPSSGSRLTPSRLLEQHGSRLSPEDTRIAQLCARTFGSASQAALLALEGHPRLYLDQSPELAVRVERAQVGLVAEERGGSVVLTGGLDGTPLEPAIRGAGGSPCSK